MPRPDRSLGTKFFTAAASYADRPARRTGMRLVTVLKIMAALLLIAAGGDVIH